MSAPPDLAPAIAAIRQQLCPGALATLLYGSRATGGHHPDSDVDLTFVTPGTGSLTEQRAVRDGLQFQVSSFPRAVLPQLPELAVRLRRPLGLFGLAEGRLVDGELPELAELAVAARAALARINASLRPEVEERLRKGLGTARMGLAGDGAGALALKLRAIPMMLESELQLLAGHHIASRSRR
jgi:predicted nucleotidyltransferase